MNQDLKKIQQVVDVVVLFASAVVALDGMWKKHGSEIKEIVSTIVDKCKKLSSNGSNGNQVITVE